MVRMFLDDWNFYKIAFARATATVKEQRSLLALASLPRSSARFKRNLARHVKEYSWTAHKLLTMNPFTEKSILERMRGIAKPEERLRALEESRRALERGYSQTVRKLARSQQKIVAQYREILYLRTERADAVGKSAALAKPLFEHIARKLGYTREELLRFSYLEIHAMLSGGKRLDPKPREKYYSWIVDGKLSVHWGSWGRPKPSQKRVEKLSGVVASKGIACGNVKIINDIPDLATFKRGNVLVARYTNPNMVVAMEQASAIVTDIGGMTSHAAIVSRELGVPCIINTKIATQVFKDGDRVEVDAEKGVV
ncbi:MAG: hypothetical protein HYS45_02780, partial [Parcubacteria group bacterium]|nr:hypothetical protein [Parcubacteria group bacterium]